MKWFACALALVSASAWAEEFDINRYCAQVAEAVGGSYQIENQCRKQEAESRAKLADLHLPARIENYCSQVASAVGGSYRIKLTCAQRELAARAQQK